MEKRGKKIMGYLIGIVFLIIGIGVLFFTIPSSKTKREFQNITTELTDATIEQTGLITEEDIANLPSSVQDYFRYTGYVGKRKTSYAKAFYRQVDFSLGKDKPLITMDYTHYNFTEEPARVALIDSSLFGIPFEGIDTYREGKGSMKGIFGKLITLFDYQGPAMDKASLVATLSECLLFPTIALQDYVVWEEIDKLHAKATITHDGVTATGIFTFNELGEMTSFSTFDKQPTTAEEHSEPIRWTAACSKYTEIDGIKQPTQLQAIWNYIEGDYVYFNSDNIHITNFYISD